ncbi:MAG: ABC transporter ATP-binding protein [Proteobacteria bacterium]|nr:ABC transporter ATP-binding protein [Pseudomonadota bacterium]
MRLELDNVVQAYRKREVLQGISFRIEQGEIGCLLGPSGCGKTTVLRCIAGFEPVIAGQVITENTVISGPGFTVPPELRGIGMVFQDFSLLPHLNVLENVEFGLHFLPSAQRRERALETLASMGLSNTVDAYPHELSGGQQQRVALARALAPNPKLLLLDEPFSSLDSELRHRLSIEVRELLKERGTTTLMVTHDQQEAFSIADRIGVMLDGQLMQWDSAYQLYHEPANRFVADFIGRGVIVSGVVEDGGIRIGLGLLEGGSDKLTPGTVVDVLLRPDDIVHDDDSKLTARVCHKEFRGADILYTLCLDCGDHLYALVPSHHNHRVGEHIGVRLEADHVVTFPKYGDQKNPT